MQLASKLLALAIFIGLIVPTIYLSAELYLRRYLPGYPIFIIACFVAASLIMVLAVHLTDNNAVPRKTENNIT